MSEPNFSPSTVTKYNIKANYMMELLEDCVHQNDFIICIYWLYNCINLWNYWGFPGGSEGKESACNSGNLGLIPRLGKSTGGGHGNPLQYFCLENPHGRGAWWVTVHGEAELEMTEQLSTAHEIISIPFMNLIDRYLKFCIYFLYLRLRRISTIAKKKKMFEKPKFNSALSFYRFGIWF